MNFAFSCGQKNFENRAFVNDYVTMFSIDFEAFNSIATFGNNPTSSSDHEKYVYLFSLFASELFFVRPEFDIFH